MKTLSFDGTRNLLFSLPFDPLHLVLGLLALIFILLVLYLFVRTVMQLLRLIAVLGLTALVGIAVWFALGILESKLGPSWEWIFFYRPIPYLGTVESILKIGVTAFVILSYMWFLLKPSRSE